MENNSNQIIEEAKKRFQQIMEYTTFRSKFVDEDNTDQNTGDTASDNTQAPPTTEPVVNDINSMPQDNMQDVPQPNSDNASNQVQNNDQAGNTPSGFNPEDNGGFNDQGIDDGMNPNMDVSGEEVGSDDDVVDITQLTDSQKDTEEKVDDLSGNIDAKFEKVLNTINKFENLIQNTDAKIDSLEKEFEKRNPTNLEKLNMQTATSYPFNIRPEDYWKEKEATSNYRTGNDNNGVGQEQYTITQNDVDGMEDWRSIYDTLSEENIFHQTMKNTAFGK